VPSRDEGCRGARRNTAIEGHEKQFPVPRFEGFACLLRTGEGAGNGRVSEDGDRSLPCDFPQRLEKQYAKSRVVVMCDLPEEWTDRRAVTGFPERFGRAFSHIHVGRP
jgi:hypothetical protein